ncbi:hypothetical protein Lsan_4150 [Legionella santicrucis]|uniref:Uncharacterized protein n=1 Tax=Legionella santicrucis TaxID=45074 RepID=A0A0W0Y9V5_9GAMM|nr:hypothetical protein [Legionella santicrucis]KTD53740.1 hypothetical protein Lsan_4150 [Legionella santicrucis]
MMGEKNHRDFKENMLTFTQELLEALWSLYQHETQQDLDNSNTNTNKNVLVPNQVAQNRDAKQNNQQDSDGPQLSQLSSSQTNTTPNDLGSLCSKHDDIKNASTSENSNTNTNDNTSENENTNSFSI